MIKIFTAMSITQLCTHNDNAAFAYSCFCSCHSLNSLIHILIQGISPIRCYCNIRFCSLYSCPFTAKLTTRLVR